MEHGARSLVITGATKQTGLHQVPALFATVADTTSAWACEAQHAGKELLQPVIPALTGKPSQALYPDPNLSIH